MEITYDYYRIFYYVAMYKSFSKAAKALMSNQPNVTHFMNNLENQLGCKLFVRSNRGVTLTAEGQKLYQHVSVAYQHIHTAEMELANEQSMKSGSITISASEIALHLLLLPILGKFHKKYPGNPVCEEWRDRFRSGDNSIESKETFEINIFDRVSGNYRWG